VLGHRSHQLGLALRLPLREQLRPLAVEVAPALGGEALVDGARERRLREAVDAGPYGCAKP
jgi:hypothetical protein